MERTEIAEKIKTLIEERNDIVVAGPDDPLDIDSFTMMLIITFVDEEFGIRLDLDKLDFDEFKSLNKFVDVVTAHEAAAANAD